MWAHVRDKVLVGGRAVVKLPSALVVDEPAPAAALDSCGPQVEHINELLFGAPSLNDGIVERAALWEVAVRCGAERLPEELMV